MCACRLSDVQPSFADVPDHSFDDLILFQSVQLSGPGSDFVVVGRLLKRCPRFDKFLCIVRKQLCWDSDFSAQFRGGFSGQRL